MPERSTIKFDQELANRLREKAESIGYNMNQFGIACMEQMLELIEQEEPRQMPRLVKMVDAALKPTGFVDFSSNQEGIQMTSDHPAVRAAVKVAKLRAARPKSGKSARKQ